MPSITRDEPSKLILTLHGAIFATSPMKNVQAAITCNGKTYKTSICQAKTTHPTWGAKFTFDLSSSTKTYLRVKIRGVKYLVKRKLGYVDIKLAPRIMEEVGAYSKTFPLVKGKGHLSATLEFQNENESNAQDTPRYGSPLTIPSAPCTKVFQCVSAWPTKSEMMREACGSCFLALLANKDDSSESTSNTDQCASPHRPDELHESFSSESEPEEELSPTESKCSSSVFTPEPTPTHTSTELTLEPAITPSTSTSLKTSTITEHTSGASRSISQVKSPKKSDPALLQFIWCSSIFAIVLHVIVAWLKS